MSVTQKYWPAAVPAPSGVASHTPDGLPIRGGPLMLRPEEMRGLGRSYDVKVRVFDLSKPDDLAEYEKTLDLIVNRAAWPIGPLPEPVWNPDAKAYHVVLRWAIPYAEVPHRLRARLSV